MGDEPMINGGRLWNSIMEMAKIGPTDKGGSCRLALTDLDREARDLFVGWCRDAGCTISVDKMGNIFARRPGTDPDLPPVVAGSHLDTQPTGGRFDGVYGVLTGLEVIRSLYDLGIQTRHPGEAACWTNEDGCRCAPVVRHLKCGLTVRRLRPHESQSLDIFRGRLGRALKPALAIYI